MKILDQLQKYISYALTLLGPGIFELFQDQGIIFAVVLSAALSVDFEFEKEPEKDCTVSKLGAKTRFLNWKQVLLSLY